MSQGWTANNPEPQKPGDLPGWCHFVPAIVTGILGLIAVVFITWPHNQQFGSDYGSLVVFGIQSSALASVFTVVYALLSFAGTSYEAYPGVKALHPGGVRVGLTALATPWVTSAAVIFGGVILLFCIGVAIALAFISSIH